MRFCIFFLIIFVSSSFVHARDQGTQSENLYQKLKGAVFQIRVIDKSSGEKSTIGSGFSVSQDGLFITNYHVVSKFIEEPARYRIEYSHEDGRVGALNVLAIDVVNDLSLLRADTDISDILMLSPEDTLQKGMNLFSMGNPHDLGMMIIDGVYNGNLDKTFYARILFSGTLNPGMSGGPAFDAKGQVIGVNVAKKGDDIGYFIPVTFVKNLIEKGDLQQAETKKEWQKIIETQLYENQENIFNDIISAEWSSQSLDEVSFPKDMSPALKCWGDGHAENNEKHHSHSWITCEGEDSIYVSSSFYTGQVSYYIENIASKRLSNAGFSEYYTDRFGAPGFYNGYRSESDAHEYECRADFIAADSMPWKAVLCVRQYKNMPSLYDTYMTMARLSAEKDGYIIEVNLQGVSQNNALSFYKKFLNHVSQ